MPEPVPAVPAAVPAGVPAAVCPVHPGRPAVDACPVCGRPRCGPDADAAPGGGCAACLGELGTVRRPASDRELLLRAVLASYAASLAMGLVVSEYVGAGVFAYVTPFLLGVLSGEAGSRAAGTSRPGPRLRAVAAVLAACGVAVGLLLEGSTGLRTAEALPLYLAAVAGTVLWTVPPGTRRPR